MEAFVAFEIDKSNRNFSKSNYFKTTLTPKQKSIMRSDFSTFEFKNSNRYFLYFEELMLFCKVLIDLFGTISCLTSREGAMSKTCDCNTLVFGSSRKRHTGLTSVRFPYLSDK